MFIIFLFNRKPNSRCFWNHIHSIVTHLQSLPIIIVITFEVFLTFSYTLGNQLFIYISISPVICKDTKIKKATVFLLLLTSIYKFYKFSKEKIDNTDLYFSVQIHSVNKIKNLIYLFIHIHKYFFIIFLFTK